MPARSDRRPRRHRHGAEEARHRDGVPELRALPLPIGRRQHRLPAEDREGARRRSGRARARGRGAARADGVSGAKAGPALGRPAAARRDGAGDRPPAERLPDGRAALEPRRQAARPDARRHRGAPGAARDDDRLRHARPGGGDDARPSRRGAEGRPPAAVRRTAGALRPARQHVRRRIHRLAGDESLHAARSERTAPSRSAGRRAGVPDAAQAAARGRTSSSAFGPRRSTSRATASPPGVEVVEELGADAYVFCVAGSAGRRARSSSRASIPPPARSGEPASSCGRASPRRCSSIPSREKGSADDTHRKTARRAAATGGAVLSGRHHRRLCVHRRPGRLRRAGRHRRRRHRSADAAGAREPEGVPGGGRLHDGRRRQGDGVPRRPRRLRGYNEVYAEFFTEPYPARTTVGAALPGGLLVEIEAVARIP